MYWELINAGHSRLVATVTTTTVCPATVATVAAGHAATLRCVPVGGTATFGLHATTLLNTGTLSTALVQLVLLAELLNALAQLLVLILLAAQLIVVLAGAIRGAGEAIVATTIVDQCGAFNGVVFILIIFQLKVVITTVLQLIGHIVIVMFITV